MVSRTIASHSVAESSEQMAAWISAEPDVAESLRKGGYGTAFNADDLFPLYQVMVSKSLAVPPASAATRDGQPAAPGRGRLMIVGVSVAFAIILLLLAFATGAFPAESRDGAGRPAAGVAAAPPR